MDSEFVQKLLKYVFIAIMISIFLLFVLNAYFLVRFNQEPII